MADQGRHREHVPGFKLDCGAGPDVPHVGIVFVHGIGQQAAGETLLDWGSKIIALLLDARAILGATGDPVIDSQLDPGESHSPYIELQLPKATNPEGQEVPEQHWVMTEAWWAQRLRPPAFGEMAEWLGPRGAIKRIVSAMLPRRRTEHDPRLRPNARVQHLEWTTVAERRHLWDILLRRSAEQRSVVKEDAEIGSVYDPSSPSAVRDALSYVGTLLAGVAAGLYFQALSALVLVLYGALRSVEKVLPIGPLKNGALTRPIDEFMLDWFGDVYVLLGDPAQAASIRGRLIESLQDLHANRCSSVAIVAHSGGAIVSYMMLADETKKDIGVDRLITLGEGLNLAWRLTTGDDGTVDPETRKRYNRLYGDMLKNRPSLIWDDFWASQDPAPVGVLAPPDKATMSAASLGRIRSHAVWNRLAFREDHGTYWDNDEEFLIPLARLLDENREKVRLFADTEADVVHSNRRRRRLSFLSVWRQLAIVAPSTAIVTAYALHSEFVSKAGAMVAQVWDKLPGNDLVSDPVDAIRSLHLENTPVDFLAEAGIWVVVASLALLTLVSMLPPPERPVPWFDAKQPWWSPFKLLARVLRFGPWVIAAAVGFVVVVAWFQFSSGATDIGAAVGLVVLRVFVATLAVAIGGSMLFGSPRKLVRAPEWVMDGIETVQDGLKITVTIGVIAVVAVLAISPFVAILTFADVGTTVLGFATVIVAFQVIGQIGIWRWNVWDGRERVSVRLQKEHYPPLLRIFFQMVILMATVGVAFVAVVTESSTLTMAAAVGAMSAVLIGVAVDVVDVARQQRRSPQDAMLQGASHL